MVIRLQNKRMKLAGKAWMKSIKGRTENRSILVLIGLVFLIAATAALWHIYPNFAATPPPANPGATPVPVTITRVVQRAAPIYLTGLGAAKAWQSVEVKVRIDGQLDKIAFEDGQDVRAGQLLAQLDPRVQQALLDQARAQKIKDQAELANARLDLARYATLIKQNSTTRQTLDTQRAEVAQLEAAIKADDAQISYAATQLSFTRITAPIDGRIGAALVDPGNIVHAADATGLVVINQIDPIAVVFTLPEAAFPRISQALAASSTPLPVIAYPPDGSEPLGRGVLTFLNNQIDATTGTIELKASFPNPQHKLWPGQYVNARLILGERPKALVVPAAVVQRGPDGVYAYTVDSKNAVHLQPIRVTDIQDGLAIIDKGLEADQRVVLDGQYKLKPGLIIDDTQTGRSAASPTGSAK